MEWKNIYRGMVMGASDIVPGVSGGTIAVLLGIYDRLIAAINGLFSRDWKKHLSFLVPLGIGVVISIFSLARLMEWFLIKHPGPTYFMFLGLIVGILPYLITESGAKANFRLNHIIILLIGIILIGLLGFLKGYLNNQEEVIIVQRTLGTYVLFFFSGFLGSTAMILPGISGSFVLLVIGVFDTVIYAIANFQLDVILVTGAGIGIGLITMSKVVHYFLTNFRLGTFAAIIGMVIGSIFVIFPGWPKTMPILLISVVTFAVGLFIAYILGKVEYEE